MSDAEQAQDVVEARLSRLYQETGDPAVKWTVHAADGTWLGYTSTPPQEGQ